MGSQRALATDPPAEAPAAQELAPVVVQGRRNPLEEADRKLEDIKEALPDLGSDLPRKQRLMDKVVSFYESHQDPNKLSGFDQEMLWKMSTGNLEGAGTRGR